MSRNDTPNETPADASTAPGAQPAGLVGKWNALPRRTRIESILLFDAWLLLGLWFAMTPSPETVEKIYSLGVYRVMAAVLTPITQAIPFSIALVLLVGVLPFLIALWVWRWRVLKKRGRGVGRRLWVGPHILLWTLPIIGLWFLVFWGAGYQRPPVEDRLAFDLENITPEENAGLRAQALAIMNDNLIPPEMRDVDVTLAAIAEAMSEVVAEWDGRPVQVAKRIKATPPGFLLSQGTAGICAPFTLEPHVDGGLPPTAFVYVGAHELGHVAGFCREAEATLIGFVAGLRADDPFARYAVALDIYLDLARQLPMPEYQKAVQDLPKQARDDIQASREASKKYRITWFDQASDVVYNRYLQSQGIKEGTKNYARGITLFIGAYRKGLATFPEPGADMSMLQHIIEHSDS